MAQEFEIPDVDDLGKFTVAALKDLRLEAKETYSALRAAITPESVTDQDLDDLEDLKTFMLLVDEELETRDNRSSRFAALDDNMDEEDLEDGGDDEEAEGDAPEPTPPAHHKGKSKGRARGQMSAATTDTSAPVESAAVTNPVPGVAQIAAVSVPVLSEPPAAAANAPKFTILAAADTGFSAGQKLDGWLDVARAFVSRSHTHSGGTAQQSTVATIRREFGNEMSISDGDDDVTISAKIDAIRDERNLPGGSLLAGAGWCAPSEVIYTTCNQITTDGIIQLPEIGARRGGIRHNKGIEFDTLFGSGTGFNILTESQVISDTTKTCAAIPCPSFVDDRLKVSALCLTGDILQNRGYPEFVSEFVQGAIASQAHNVSRQIIADMVADSTAVSLSTGIWASDGTVLSQVLSAVEMASVDIQYRLRLQRNQTIEFVFPYWLKAQIRADFIRRTGVDNPDLSDAQIDDMLRNRNARAQWVYNWQDAFTSTGVTGNPALPGSDIPVTALPSSVSFLAYPSGTWVVARQDVIRLDTIYDSTNLATNKVTQLFLEDGFRAMRFCPISRVYTAAICGSGATTQTASRTC